jgi:hypothetical protein
LHGRRAVEWLGSIFPADLILFSGLRLDRLANLGGLGPAAYSAEGLRRLPADLANRLELIVGPGDLAWSCVFCHEAGALGSEQLFAGLAGGGGGG